MVSPEQERLDYLQELLNEYKPDIVGLTEFRESSSMSPQFQALADKHGFTIDFESSIEFNGEREGILVMHLGQAAVTRSTPWPAVTLKSRFGTRWDRRQAVRCELQGFAVHFGHVTHPHESVQLSRRRTAEWQAYRKILHDEPLPFAWFADTNTTLARTVQKRLGNVALLLHDRPTWGFRPMKDRRIGAVQFRASTWQTPRILHLDRCAVRPDLADAVQFKVVPPIVNDTVCPSDHLPLFFSGSQ